MNILSPTTQQRIPARAWLTLAAAGVLYMNAMADTTCNLQDATAQAACLELARECSASGYESLCQELVQLATQIYNPDFAQGKTTQENINTFRVTNETIAKGLAVGTIMDLLGASDPSTLQGLRRIALTAQFIKHATLHHLPTSMVYVECIPTLPPTPCIQPDPCRLWGYDKLKNGISDILNETSTDLIAERLSYLQDLQTFSADIQSKVTQELMPNQNRLNQSKAALTSSGKQPEHAMQAWITSLGTPPRQRF